MTVNRNRVMWAAAAAGAWLVADSGGGPSECVQDRPSESLYDGEQLGHWQPVRFGGEGLVHVAFDGSLTLEPGAPLTGVVWTGPTTTLPRCHYEIALEAKKHYGEDFFCALTFPVKDAHATLVCGGWGGEVTGISSIDGRDASVNETCKRFPFERERWYSIRVRVTAERLTVWIDDAQLVDLDLAGKSLGLRPGPIEKCAPLGLATYFTKSAFRRIELRRLAE